MHENECYFIYERWQAYVVFDNYEGWLMVGNKYSLKSMRETSIDSTKAEQSKTKEAEKKMD